MSAPEDRPRRARRGRLTALMFLLTLAGVATAWWWQHRAPQLQTAPGGPPPAGAPASPAAGAAPPAAGGGAGTAPRRFTGANRAQPVTAGRIERRDLQVIQPAIGTISALNTAVVRPRVDAELRAIHFTEGQMVRAGQLLAELDPRAFEVQLAQAEGQLARDQAQLANARNDLTRYQDLAARDAIARQQLDTQAALVKQLSASIRIGEAAVENARLMLSYTRITAPIAGQVGLRQADLGNLVRAGDTNGIVVITQTQPISVVFSVPESVLPRIRARLAGKERPRVEAWDRELRNRLAEGEIISTDNSIDLATGTIRIKASFDNRDGALFPNQFVNIRLQLEVLRQTLTAPATAIQRGAAGAFIYLIDGEGAVSVRPVQVGVRDGDWVAIDGDLRAGDRVVTDGADRLRQGARVEVITPRPAARPASGSGSTGSGAGPGAAAGNSGAAGGAGSGPAAAQDLPPWFDRLSTEMQQRYLKMTPEERAEFARRMRERQQQQQRPPQ